MLDAIIPDIIQSLIQNRGNILLKGALAVGIFIAIYLISQFIVRKVRERIQNNSLQNDTYTEKMSKLAGNIVFTFLMIFNVLAVFQVIGFDTAILMGGISLSLGFAMETTIENMVAGIMFITSKKVKIGEYVEFLGSVNLRGTMEEINVRYSIIRLFDKRRVILPNSVLAATPIKTFKTEPLMRGEFVIKVPRHVDVNQVQELLNKTINENKYVLQKEYTSTIITGFDGSGIGMKTFFFASPQKKSPAIVARDMKPIVLEAFKKYGIRIPYAHLTVNVE